MERHDKVSESLFVHLDQTVASVIMSASNHTGSVMAVRLLMMICFAASSCAGNPMSQGDINSKDSRSSDASDSQASKDIPPADSHSEHADRGRDEARPSDRHPHPLGGYMDPCSDGPMCETGLCAPWDDPKSEGFCTRICTTDEECGEGLTCPPPVGFAEDYSCADGASCVCLSSTMFLCKSCDKDKECSSPASPSTQGHCLPEPGRGWGYCASDCDGGGPCPPAYTCKPVHIRSEDVMVCVPEAGGCEDL